MAFAPVWSKKDNNSYLNDVVEDIIHTKQQNPGTGFCGTAGYDEEEDTVEVPWDEQFLRKPPETRSQTPFSVLSARQSRHLSIAELDESIRRSGTPISEAKWSLRRSGNVPEDILSIDYAPPRPFSRQLRPQSEGLDTSASNRNSDTPILAEDDSSVDLPRQLFPPHPAVKRASRANYLYDESFDWDKHGSSGMIMQDLETASDEDYPSSWKLTLIVVGICLSVFLISLDRNIITTAIPKITEDFGAADDIGWYGSAYLMTACAFQPLYGRVYTLFSTKSTFLVALFAFEIGSLLCALAPSSIPLIAGRAIQGYGSAGILTGGFLVITQSVPLQKRPVFFAAIGILYGAGATVGPLLGGVFTDKVSWRWCFWFNLPVGAVTFLTMFLFFRPKVTVTHNKPTFLQRFMKLDFVSNALLLGGCIMIFMALEGPDSGYAWKSAYVIGLFAGGGTTFILLALWQWYMGDNGLLPPKIILQRTVASSCLVAVVLYGVLGMHAYFLPIWFQAVQGNSAIQSGVHMIPYMLANALFGLLAGIFVSKNGYFTPPAVLGCAIGTAGCGLLTLLHVSTPSSHWIGYQVLVSAGLGMAVQQGFVAVQTVLPLAQVPIGTAAVVASQSFGGAIFISVGNTIFQNTLLNGITSTPVLSNIDTSGLTSTGITSFRSMLSPEQILVLLGIYNSSLRYVFIACVPLAGLAFLFSLGLEWKSVKEKGPSPDLEKPQEKT